MSGPTELDVFVFQFLNQEKSIKDLEDWAYSNSKLEEHLSEDDYLTFISLDFEHKYAPVNAKKILSKLINANDYIAWKLHELMGAIIIRSSDVHISISDAYELYSKGCQFLHKLGVDFGLSVASAGPEFMGWDSLNSYEQDKLIDGFYPEIIEHAKRVIVCLDEGKIEFTGNDFGDVIDGVPHYLKYVDRRSRKEKKLMGGKVINLDKLHVRLLRKFFRIQLSSWDFDR